MQPCLGRISQPAESAAVSLSAFYRKAEMNRKSRQQEGHLSLKSRQQEGHLSLKSAQQEGHLSLKCSRVCFGEAGSNRVKQLEVKDVGRLLCGPFSTTIAIHSCREYESCDLQHHRVAGVRTAVRPQTMAADRIFVVTSTLIRGYLKSNRRVLEP
jgi:hypothetical protein